MSQSPSPERPISRIAFTPAVKAAQEERGSRAVYAKMETRGQQGPWRDSITPELEEFLAERDTLYLGTVSGDGQPYVQHRGGPRGFIKVLDDHTGRPSGAQKTVSGQPPCPDRRTTVSM